MLKYVRLPGNEIIIFPLKVGHIVFGNLKPVSAGFCEVSRHKPFVECYGASDSLRLKADPQKDSALATLQLFGTEPGKPDSEIQAEQPM